MNYLGRDVSQEPSIITKIEDHLNDALDADDPGDKNFHIRNALQLEELEHTADQTD